MFIVFVIFIHHIYSAYYVYSVYYVYYAYSVYYVYSDKAWNFSELGLGFRVQGFEFRVQVLCLLSLLCLFWVTRHKNCLNWVQGLRFRDWVLEFRVQALGNMLTMFTRQICFCTLIHNASIKRDLMQVSKFQKKNFKESSIYSDPYYMYVKTSI